MLSRKLFENVNTLFANESEFVLVNRDSRERSLVVDDFDIFPFRGTWTSYCRKPRWLF